ncbi:hypothetical protein SBADM41S_10527 [Streptomyces badius]
MKPINTRAEASTYACAVRVPAPTDTSASGPVAACVLRDDGRWKSERR